VTKVLRHDQRSTVCTDCGEPVDSNAPCSKCGSTRRTVQLSLDVSQRTEVKLRKEWDIPMEQHRANFKAWYAHVLEGLYANQNAGIAAFMVTLPLLERYLRLKSGMTLKDHYVKKPFRAELGIMFPALRDDQVAEKFWTIFRHGFLHHATLSFSWETDDGDMLPIGRLTHHPVQYSVRIESDGSFTVNPVSFSRTVVSAIEGDFVTYVGKDLDALPLPKVYNYSEPDGQSMIVSTSSRQ
jgi:hypothetical protein